ncbi:MAG: 2Fe-2S iron-sulfur cluster-binding protein [Planctomycetota bacterium]
MADVVKITLNGKPVEVPKNQTILNAAHERGLDVPIFCYHKGLETSGYCRMCLVEVDSPRGKRLITSCNTPVSEGLVVDTHSPKSLEGRAAVLEFLLLNHPLDCPTCDKAGECMLQDNSFDHGKAHSRMDFADKLVKPRKDLGDKIRLYPQRCIACRRCTQFLDQVSGTSELAFHERGNHTELDIFPGKPIHNSLAKNIVDICPVGALIDRDFQYTTRQWLMKPVSTICSGCSKGCAVEADTEDGEVKRFKAREDAQVNGFWMCDHGRDLSNTLKEGRRTRALVSGKAVSEASALEAARAALAEGATLVASAFSTREEVTAALAVTGGRSAGAIARPLGLEEKFPGFTIPADKNPNRAGVKAVLGGDGDVFDSTRLIHNLKGATSVLLINAIPQWRPDETLLAALKAVPRLVVIEAWASPVGDLASATLPGAAPTEKEGTFVNDKGLERRLTFCVPGPGRMDLDWLTELRALAGARA